MADLSAELFGRASGPVPAPARAAASGPYVPVVIESGWETGLDPALVEKVRQLQKLAAEEGITVGITAGHRTREQQARLYAQGRTAPGGIITYAKPGSSRHETGRAVDIFALKDGKPDYASPAWKRLGELGKSLGLEWGWEWKRFKDRPHFQLRHDPTEPPAAAPAPANASAGPSALSPTFQQRVDAMAQRLGANPQHLLQVMQFETAGTMDPTIRNRAGSGATGLIQFTRETARGLGTTTEALARMTPEEQLVYVEKYLQPYKGRLKTLDDTYMAVLYPEAIGKGPDYPLFRQGTRAYQQNAALDVDQRGQVTVGSAMRFVRRKLGDVLSPASAEAAPMSPARQTQTPPGRGSQLFNELFGTTPGAGPAAPAPATPAPATPAPVAPAPAGAAPGAAPPFDARALAAQELARLQQEETQRLSNWRMPVATGISAGSAMLGLAAGGAVHPMLAIPGEMAGAYLGRQANIALGLEEGTPWSMEGQDVATLAIPPVMRGITKIPAAAKAVVKRLPGASTAMHQDVADRLAAMSDRLLPAIPAEQHYAQVALQNPLITPSAVAREAGDIVAKEMTLAPGLRNPRLLRVARDLHTLAQQDVPLQDLYAHQQRVGELVRDFRSKGGVGEGRIKQLYAAFHADLEAAAAKGVPGAQTLKDAIAASRKEHIVAELDDLFQPGKSGLTIDPEGRVSINGGRLETAWRTKLRRDKVFRDTLSQEEKGEVEEIITLAKRLERLSTPRGGQRGSGRAAVGAAVGSAIGGPAGAAFAVYAPEVIAMAMKTKAGRALVLRALQDGRGTIEPQALAALGAAVRQQSQEPAAGGVQEGQQIQVEPGRLTQPQAGMLPRP